MSAVKEQLVAHINNCRDAALDERAIARKMFLLDPTFVFKEDSITGFKILNAVSERFRVPLGCVKIAGSSQIGFSSFQNRDFTQVVGYYNRNEQIKDLLEQNVQTFPERDDLTVLLNNAAQLFLKLKLKNLSFWYGKSNAFSLLSIIAERYEGLRSADLKKIKLGLDTFAENPPADYSLAAKEAVNNKKERVLRRDKLDAVITQSLH
jgi:hypothetical protein